MAVEGISRYFRLWKHIANPGEYMFRRGDRHDRDLIFRTKPFSIRFHVSKSVYALFKELFMEDVYEIDALVKDLPSTPVVIDIGANVGFFDIQLLSKIENATIYAYEPIPANVRTLQNTLQQNPRLEQSVRLFPVAVTGKPLDKLELFAETDETSQVVASAISGFHENNSRKITVPCTSLTDIIQNNDLQSIDFLKMDCEGSEYDIMYHTDRALIRRIKKMMIEVHDLDKDRNNISAFNQYVQALGYKTRYSPINSFCYALEATRQ